MAITAQTVEIMGGRQSGQDVRDQNGNTLILTLVIPDSVGSVRSIGPNNDQS